jgi:hypothetical protein
MTLAIGAVGDALLAAVLQLHSILDDAAVQAIYGLCFFLYLKVFWVLVALAAASAHATLRSRVRCVGSLRGDRPIPPRGPARAALH